MTVETLKRKIRKEIEETYVTLGKHRKYSFGGVCLPSCTEAAEYRERIDALKWVLEILKKRRAKNG